jgi:cell division septation protein DedD
MQLTSMLEVGIGLVFVWLVISIATMQIVEWIGTALKWRSKYLESTVRQMLSDPALAGKLYQHPLINKLRQDIDLKPEQKDVIEKFIDRISNLLKIFVKKQEARPSYIPANTFALALFDIITTAGTEKSVVQQQLAQFKNEIARLPDADKAKARGAISKLIKELADQHSEQIDNVLSAGLESIKKANPKLERCLSDSTFKQLTNKVSAVTALSSLLDLVSPPAETGSNAGKGLDANLQSGIAIVSLLHPDLKQTLSGLVGSAAQYADTSEKNIALARTNVETWFDSTMERLGGWYKRRTIIFSLVIGVILALVFNVDSLQLSIHLWKDPVARGALVAQASQFQPPEPAPTATTEPVVATPDPNATPAPTTAPAEGESTPEPTATPTEPPNPAEVYQYVYDQLGSMNIPIGWTTAPLEKNKEECLHLSGNPKDKSLMICYGGQKISNLPVANNALGWLAKLIGWLITGFAAAQGSPFWFDILKKMINVRSTGANPAEQKPKAESGNPQ